MNTEKLKPALIMLSLIGVLTFLFIKTREYDVGQDIILSIQQLSHQDALLNESVLKFKANRFSNYDSITRQNKIIKEHLEWLIQPESGFHGAISTEMDRAIDAAVVDFMRKLELVERFKSYNGTLKNSMNYLPVAMDRSQKNPANADSKSDMEHLMREVLLFNTWPNDKNESVASMYIDALQDTQKPEMLELAKHASTIITHGKRVKSIVDTLFELPTTSRVDEIYRLYSEHYTGIVKAAAWYRTAMYALALLMLFYLMQLFLTLRRTMHDLEASLGEVAFQKDALDEHAIVLSIEPDGALSYVNDKFVEVSKYSRDEVVGKPWSALESDTSSGEIWNALNEGYCWKGELKNTNKSGSQYWVDATVVPFIDKHGKPIRHIALLTDTTERKRNEERIFNLAHYDELTRLPNRAFFLDNLEKSLVHCRKAKEKLAVLFLDLDNFKMINDTMGHASGDELLKIVGNHLQASVKDAGTVSRLGGDEFTITLNDVKSISDIDAIVTQIMSITERTVMLETKEIVVSTSMGVSIFPDNANDSNTLLKHADIAMYQAKSEGKNRCRFFSDEMNQESMERHSIESELRVAIKNREFELFYQPQVVAETGEICAVEALIRWNHPEKGMISPDLFIPVLEDSGLINVVGKWVLMESCAQLVAWKNLGYDMKMAVNISAYQVRDTYIVDLIKQLLVVHSFDPKDLELELTESSFLHNTSNSVSILTALSELGVNLSLDDFGTGYSSLSHLKKLPIDTLKIDRSFVSDLPHDDHDLAIATTILAMAKSLDLKVVAEGVETVEQSTFLNEHGCDYLQGYYFSKPLPAEELVHILEDNRAMIAEQAVIRIAR